MNQEGTKTNVSIMDRFFASLKCYMTIKAILHKMFAYYDADRPLLLTLRGNTLVVPTYFGTPRTFGSL